MLFKCGGEIVLCLGFSSFVGFVNLLVGKVIVGSHGNNSYQDGVSNYSWVTSKEKNIRVKHKKELIIDK